MLGVEVDAGRRSRRRRSTGADIVMCATNRLDNMFFERWIEPGMHLSSIKRPEIEIKRASSAPTAWCCTPTTAAPIHVTTRDLAFAEKAKEHGWARRPRRSTSTKLPTLPDLIAGQRRRPQVATREVTCFINNIGLGYQFAAAGARGLPQGQGEPALGHELPTDWFTEDVHP